MDCLSVKEFDDWLTSVSNDLSVGSQHVIPAMEPEPADAVKPQDALFGLTSVVTEHEQTSISNLLQIYCNSEGTFTESTCHASSEQLPAQQPFVLQLPNGQKVGSSSEQIPQMLMMTGQQLLTVCDASSCAIPSPLVGPLFTQTALQQPSQHLVVTPVVRFQYQDSIGTNSPMLSVQLPSDGTQLVRAVTTDQLMQQHSLPISVRQTSSVDRVPTVETTVSLSPPIVVNTDHLETRPINSVGCQQLQWIENRTSGTPRGTEVITVAQIPSYLVSPVTGWTQQLQTSSAPVMQIVRGKVPISRISPPPALSSGRSEKRTSHNATEQRYRLSINGRIDELRDTILHLDSKVKKATVLRKTIEYVKVLQRTYKRLVMQNRSLRMSLTGKGFPSLEGTPVSLDTLFDVTDLTDIGFSSELEPSEFHRCICPDSSMPPSPVPGIFESSSASTASVLNNSGCESSLETDCMSGDDDDSDVQYGGGGIPGSRLALFAFMFTLLAVNPLGVLIGGQRLSSSSDGQPVHGSGRTMLSAVDDGRPVSFVKSWLDWMLPVFVWLVNIAITVALVVKVFIFEEVTVKHTSKSATSFYTCQLQAECYIKQGNYSKGAIYLRRCLKLLGRPLPESPLALIASLCWNCIRQLFHLIRFGWWLEYAASRLFIWAFGRDLNAQTTEAVLIYRKLLQLHLSGCVKESYCHTINIALCSINLVESPGSVLSANVVAEIYALTAIFLKDRAPACCALIIYYLLNVARCTNSVEIPSSHVWLRHPLGHQYFLMESWSVKSTNYCSSDSSDKTDPMASIARGFREHILTCACAPLANCLESHLVSYASEADGEGESVFSCCNACRILPLVVSCYETVSEIDQISQWWAGVAVIALCWHTGKKVPSKSIYEAVDIFPALLDYERRPLAKCIYLAYKAKRLAYDGFQLNIIRVLCNQSSELLQQCLAVPNLTSKPNMNDVYLLICDWLLTMRTDLWLDQRNGDRTHDLAAFYTDLASLRKLAFSSKSAMKRVLVHEATLRLMAGASPERTLQLYERNLRGRRHHSAVLSNVFSHVVNDVKRGESTTVHRAPAVGCVLTRNRAAAAVIVCQHSLHHFPRSDQQPSLTEDATMYSYEKPGDHHSLTNCRQLMCHFITSAAPIGC